MLAPYAGDHPPPTPPWVTLALVGLNVGVFALVAATSLAVGADLPVRWFALLGLMPDAPRWYAFLTYCVLHEDLFHLSVNMLVLWVFAGSSEHAFGRRRLVFLYASAAVFSGFVEVLVARQGATEADAAMIIGASGASAAIVGAFTAAHHRARVHVLGTRWSMSAIAMLACVAAAEIAALALGASEGAVPGRVDAAHWAHIAGFVYGMGWAYASGSVRRASRQYAARDAECEAANGTPFGAAARWQALLQASPDDEQAAMGLIEALLSAGEIGSARARLLDAASHAIKRHDRPKAVRLLTAFPDLSAELPTGADRILSLAAQVEEAGHPGIAADMLRPIAEHPGTPETAYATLRLASCLVAMGRTDEALVQLERSDTMDLDDAWRRRARQLRESCAQVTTAAGRLPPTSTE